MSTVEHMPPVTCQPWCQEGDGHPQEVHPDDQQCSSTWQILHPAPAGWSHEGAARDKLSIAAQRRPYIDGGRPLVLIWSELHDVETWLSPSDARALADELVNAARLIEEAGR